MSTIGKSLKGYSARNLFDFSSWRDKAKKIIGYLNIFSVAFNGFFKHSLEKSKYKREEIRLRGVNKSLKRETDQKIKRDWMKPSYFG